MDFLNSLSSDDKLLHTRIGVFLYSISVFIICVILFKQHHKYSFLRNYTSINNSLSTLFIHLLHWRSLSLSCQMQCMTNWITPLSYNPFTYHKTLGSFYRVKVSLFNSIFPKVLFTLVDRNELLHSFHDINWFVILRKINMFTIVTSATLELKTNLWIQNCNNWNWLW